MLTPFDFKDYEFNNDEKIEDIFRTSPVHCTVGKQGEGQLRDRGGQQRRRQGEEVQAVGVCGVAAAAAAVSNKVG